MRALLCRLLCGKPRLPHIEILRLEDGDTLVVSYPEDLTVNEAEETLDQIRRAFDGHKALLLTGCSLSVVRRIDGPATP